MQTPEGLKKTKITNHIKHGGEEGYKQHMRRIATIGGRISNPDRPKGFAAMYGPKQIEASRKGGRISKRGKGKHVQA